MNTNEAHNNININNNKNTSDDNVVQTKASQTHTCVYTATFCI